MTEQIQMLRIDALEPHPSQGDIYGEIAIEGEFLATVRDKGILTPLTVAETDSGKYIIVSGHRRHEAARQAGHNEVPCIVRRYQSEAEMTLEFLAMNIQREKNIEQRKREYFEWVSVLKQLAKVHRTKETYRDTEFYNSQLLSALRDLKINPEESLNSYKILKDITGLTEWEQRLMRTVYDNDFRISKLSMLRKSGLKIADEEKIANDWDEIRAACDKKKATLREAYESVNQIIKHWEGKLEKKPKPAKNEPKPKPKEVEEYSFEIEMDCEPGQILKPGPTGATYSETPLDYEPEVSEIDYITAAGGVHLGIIRTHKMPVGFAVGIAGVNYVIDTEMLATILVKIESKL
jgi:hypothetical protein